MNVSNIFPLIKDSIEGKYIDLDFSENIVMRPKSEVKNAHFTGKQYTLHYATVELGEQKYVYQLSDDTLYDSNSVNEVLEDIFGRWNIRDEAIIVKRDHAPTQCKNKNAFFYMQSLGDRFNVVIVRIFGAAGHGKGLIDAISSFGIRSVLRCDIITLNKWFF